MQECMENVAMNWAKAIQKISKELEKKVWKKVARGQARST